MNARVIPTVLFFVAIGASGQQVAQQKTQAQCKFSDGKRITVIYSSERGSYQLSTNEPLIAAGGVTVLPGDYTVIRSWDGYSHFLILQKATEKTESSKLPRIPMSASVPSVHEKKDPVSFVSTGGSCTMQFAPEKSDKLLSLEFTEKNTDMPVIE